MNTREERVAILQPLVDRMCTTHCWRDHRHLDKPFGLTEINEHLAGAHRYGLCPITPGESSCQVALLDLDSHKGETDFPAMRRIADGIALDLELEGYVPVLFRSSGGKGIHLYLTFGEPQEAYSVREVLAAGLARCGLKNGTAGVSKGEVEIFPKQPEVPSDGFGSMWVLPFAGQSELLT